MAGNTRGKLKEHLEGIHRNLDWCLHHTNASLQLIEGQLHLTEEMIAAEGDKEQEKLVCMKNPVFKGISAMGEGISQIDEIAQALYGTL